MEEEGGWGDRDMGPFVRVLNILVGSGAQKFPGCCADGRSGVWANGYSGIWACIRWVRFVKKELHWKGKGAFAK